MVALPSNVARGLTFSRRQVAPTGSLAEFLGIDIARATFTMARDSSRFAFLPMTAAVAAGHRFAVAAVVAVGIAFRLDRSAYQAWQ